MNTQTPAEAALNRKAERLTQALVSIVRHANMPRSEGWERAYGEVTMIAFEALAAELNPAVVLR